MEKLETQKILNKITIFRQSFLIRKDTIDEWHKILKPYRYEDVDKKLDDYFKESNNFGQYPDAYYLTRYLRTEEELTNNQDIYSRCSLCGKIINYNEYKDHFNRCSDIDYIKKCGKEHLHKKFDENKLWEMNNTTFNELYWKVCEETFKIIPDNLEKHSLENALLTHYGKKPKYTISELNKAI